MKQNELNSAVYEALCRIAEKNLDHVADVSPSFRRTLSEKGFITAAQCVNDRKVFYETAEYGLPEKQSVDIGSFHAEFICCEWPIFSIIEKFRKLAKGKPFVYYMREEETARKLHTVTFDFNGHKASALTKFVEKEKYYSEFYKHVIMEIDTEGHVTFCSGFRTAMAYVTDGGQLLGDDDVIFRAAFTPAVFRKICGLGEVTFDIYENSNDFNVSGVVARSGNTVIRSFVDCNFIKWRFLVLQMSAAFRLQICKNDVRPANAFIKSMKTVACTVSVSAGSPVLHITEMAFNDKGIPCPTGNEAVFTLENESPVTAVRYMNPESIAANRLDGFIFYTDDGKVGIITDSLQYELLSTLRYQIEVSVPATA